MESKANILVINSDAEAQEKIKARLLDAGYSKLTIAGSGDDALCILRKQTFDLIITEIDVTDIDGWRLSRLIRSGALFCDTDIPILIATSTWCERIAEVTAREYGINVLLPLDKLDELVDKIEDCLDRDASLSGKPSLLVIEDEIDTSDLVERVLSPRFEIQVCADGEQGLQAWNEKRHDLVLLDIMLPNRSGKEILIQILTQSPDQPVVMMTAHTTAEVAEDLMLLGATDFIPKPFRPEQLRKVCEIAIRREDYMVSNAQFASHVQSLAESESAYRKLSNRHQQLLNNLQTVVVELDENLVVKFLNSSWEILTGYKVQDSIGRSFKDFVVFDDKQRDAMFESSLASVLMGQVPHCDIEISLTDREGNRLWAQIKVSRSTYSEEIPYLTICLDDVTKRKHAQEQLEYLATHDSLTGLFNRYYFETSLEYFAEDAKENARAHGLIYLDLDYFKVINDSYGHHLGDDVLREISTLIAGQIRGKDLLCRLGGDEYAVLLHDVDKEKLREFALKIQKIINDFSFQTGSHRANLGCCVGLSMIDGSANSSEEYLMQADIALYVAKGRGRNLVHFFDPEDNESEELRSSINWAQKLRHAMSEDRVILHFQPIFDVEKDRIAYYEALVRIVDKDGELVYPDNFIPALETTGEMHLLDRWIIKLAITSLRDHPELENISINLSAQAFKDENLVPVITESLESTGVSASCITFELTESASLFNLNITKRVISELHQLGCSFAVDDFGSGFSSFSYLKQLPADYIKLDGSFIRNLDHDTVDQALVRSIIQVIQALGKKTVAEFVENEAILNLLKKYGIDFVQGYHVGYPLPVEQLFGQKKNKDLAG